MILAVTIIDELLRSFTESINAISILVYSLLGFIFVIVSPLLLEARRVWKQVEQAENDLVSLAPPGGLQPNQLQDLQDLLPDQRVFREQWQEFREGCVEINDSLFNTIAADAFLKDDTFLQSISWWWLHFPLVRSIPGIATGLGLLGTFLGIVVGLGRLSLHQQEILDHIGPVIGALSSAFWTSIIGVLLAIAMTFYGHGLESRLLASLHNFREALDRRIPRLTSQKILNEIRDQLSLLEEIKMESEEGRGFLQTMANDLANRIGDRFDKALTDRLAPALTEITTSLKVQMERAAETSTAEARRFTDEMVNQITGSLQQGMSNVSEQLKEAGTGVRDMTDVLNQVVANAKDAVQTQRMAIEEGNQAVQTAQKRSETAADQLALVEEVAHRLSELTERLVERQKALSEAQERQSEINASSSAAASNIVTSFGDAQEAYAETASKLTAAVGDVSGLLGGLSATISTLDSSSNAVANRLDEAVAHLNQRLDSEAEVLGRFGEASAQIAELIETAAPLGRQLQQAANTLQQTLAKSVSEREDLAQQRALAQELQEAAKESIQVLNQELREAAGTMLKASGSMNETAETLDDWAAGATNAIEMFGEGLRKSIESSLTEYDSSLASAVDALRAAMTELEDIADDIEEAASRVTQSGGSADES